MFFIIDKHLFTNAMLNFCHRLTFWAVIISVVPL